MKVSRMISGLVPAALVFMFLVPGAQASNETATSELIMTPVQGQLFEELAKPVNWEVAVEIKAPAGSSKVTPVKEIHAQMPREMSFNPDPDMAVCPDSKIGPGRNLAIPPNAAIDLCPRSVLGNGTAEHYIGGANNTSGPTLRDGVVVVFNGGRTAGGLPKIKIYGFSAQAATGIYMEGVLKDGKLDVSIPVLPFDSATARFHLFIPGSKEVHEDRRGQDPAYVRAACTDGLWEGQVDFLLGERDPAGGPVGLESTVFAPPLRIACDGVPGKATLGELKVKGPSSAKAGKKVTYRVTVRNSGTATAGGLNLSAAGKGVRGASSLGSLAPGKSKTIRIWLKFTRKGTTKVKFKVKGRGLKTESLSRKVKVL